MAQRAVPRHLAEAIIAPMAQARSMLYVWYIILPLVAGLDKFTMLLVDWTRYLATPVAQALPVSPYVFMYGVGIVEVAAAVIVAVSPRVGGVIAGLWLIAIALNLIIGQYYDVAVRDIGLAIGAFALARLSTPEAERVS